MNKKLFFFTHSFPYGIGELWKENEIRHFVKYFDSITVIPHIYGGNFTNPKKLPEGVKCTEPLFKNLAFRATWVFLYDLLSNNFFYYMREFFRARVFLSKKKLVLWISATAFTQRLLKHAVIKNVLTSMDKNTVLYFFWGIGSCLIVPFIDKKVISKIVVRLHGYDLFEEDYDDYIPYRKDLLKNISLVAHVSEKGLDYLRLKYPDIKLEMGVYRLGVIQKGEAGISQDGILRIVTCSKLVPLKRINIIIDALRKLSIQVKWTHIGDGPLFEAVKKEVARFPGNITVNFMGWLSADNVLPFYAKNNFDLFLNVSETENVPVSVMEALSAAIPVYATDVGGTTEIVDNTVGKLLPAGLTPVVLAEELQKFYSLSEREKRELRKNATERYRKMCNADVLADEMGKMLSM